MHCPAWILPHEICSVSEYTPHADEPMDAELRRGCSQPHRVCGVNWISLCSWDICSRHGYQNWRSKTLSLILRHSHFTWCKTLTITSSWPTFWCHGTVLSPDFASRQIKQQNATESLWMMCFHCKWRETWQPRDQSNAATMGRRKQGNCWTTSLDPKYSRRISLWGYHSQVSSLVMNNIFRHSTQSSSLPETNSFYCVCLKFKGLH